MTAVVEPLCSQFIMDVTHPGPKPLTEGQSALLRTIVDEIKRHPDVTKAFLQKLRSEVSR